ncbi:DUF305 domain-containing protein [Streptomyces sp. NPDC045431]|uniref:DUF305 domain-containing protein n=1 Tax=Streptomyces sp. NPDC045431 TaxID=3155613 RepID=UPI0033ED4582
MTRTHLAAAVAIVLALLFAGVATVATAGGKGGEEEARTPAADSADAGFARDMSDHHQQAVEMSFIVRDRTADEEVRRLAYDIANTQANQRGMMMGWLDLWELPKVAMDQEPMAWMGTPSHGSSHSPSHGSSHGSVHGSSPGAQGLMPGMATKAELDRLRAASGKEAEVLYLQLMIDHHKGGVHMAQGCVDKCEVGVEQRLAQGMVDAQESEVRLMTDMLAKRGAKPRG